MEFLIQEKGMSEDHALISNEDCFCSNQSAKANKPDLASCKKDRVRTWGKVDLKKGVLVIHPPLSHSI
jgi:hypothetical protein